MIHTVTYIYEFEVEIYSEVGNMTEINIWVFTTNKWIWIY